MINEIIVFLMLLSDGQMLSICTTERRPRTRHECGKVYIVETGRASQDRRKEHDRDIRLAHRYTCRVKEAIQIRLHSNNINRDIEIEIPEAWIPKIRKHNSRSTTKWTYEGTSSVSRNNNEDQNAPITANQLA